MATILKRITKIQEVVLLRRPIIAGRGSGAFHQDHPDQDGGGLAA
jgi:hypothetical protein